ncbi:MAG: hypothetical protein HRT40_09050 [Campylobacteraceae bacterium]|nr:hypothetical protein [Campylobacteraceae bacterium]
MEVHNIRGYLYEIFIGKHLKDNGFDECVKGKRTRGCIVNGKGEIEGRGEYHQIDFTGVYTKLTPYIYPLRVLAECKYYKKPLSKNIIRQYIGVMKDISENYYVPSKTKKSNKESIFDKQISRFTDIPIIFSVNGFDTHSENLAWAQGINLVSHKGIPIFDEIIKIINDLSELIYKISRRYSYKESDLINLIKYTIYEVSLNSIFSIREFINKLHTTLIDNDLGELHMTYHQIENFIYCEEVYSLSKKIKEINTFIIVTTEKGTVLNLVSKDNFPTEFFQINENMLNDDNYNPNRAQVGVYFENLNNVNRDRVFYLQFNQNGHEDDRKFYFQPNRQMLSEQFPELSEDKRIDLKRSFVGVLTFIYEINKVTRVLELEVKFPYETREELNNMLKFKGLVNE